MSKVVTTRVVAADDGVRLDRWFHHHYPGLGHGRLQKLLRTGQVRVDGGRVKSGTRLAEGQNIRIPPLSLDASEIPREKPAAVVSRADARDLKARILYQDEDIIVLNKPAGLAVQGGSRLSRNLDAMLDALRFDKEEKPRLVHRLDRDTSGVLLLARHAPAARFLTKAFKTKVVRKIYWAIVVGVPTPDRGMIDLSLAKLPGAHGEKVVGGTADGKKAQTLYRTVDRAGERAAWMVLEPLTGRTHQLRVHAQALGTPILGDGKYGRRKAFLEGEDISERLHLHARALRFPHPFGQILDIEAPLPEHMEKTFKALGFRTGDEKEPFADDIFDEESQA